MEKKENDSEKKQIETTETFKVVDDLFVPMNYQRERSPIFCFVVFSSNEEHIEIVIDCIETVFNEIEKYEVRRLDSYLRSGDSQYAELKELLSTCAFAIVILDGLRPNVIFEYGILKGLGKPCIVLLENNACFDVKNLYDDPHGEKATNPLINIDKHFSDVKDRFYVRYNKNNPKEIRKKLRNEYKKLESNIEKEFLNVLYPYMDFVEKELASHLTNIIDIYNKNKEDISDDDIVLINVVGSEIKRITKDYNLRLSKQYFSIIAGIYEKVDDFEQAIAILEPVIDNTSDDIPLLENLAYLYKRIDKLPEAMSALDAALKLNSELESLWHNKGLIYEKLEKPEEALLCYKKGLKYDPSCSMLHFHYGMLLYQEGENDSALSEFQNALDISPTVEVFLLWKARTLKSLKKIEEARIITEDIIATYPDYAAAWFTLGQLAKDDNTALEHFNKALSLEPKHGGAICSRAACLSNLGEHQEALAIFKTMDGLCDESKTCENLLQNVLTTLENSGQLEEAINNCDSILSTNANNVIALSSKARFLVTTGKEAEGIKLFNRSIEIKPEDGELFYNLACTYAKIQNCEKAIEYLSEAITLESSFRENLKTDPDFDLIRDRKEFIKILDTANE